MNGYEFNLWVYDSTLWAPPGTVLRDATEILPPSRIFTYPVGGPIDLKHGEGSVAGFSDLFRYKLLFEKGGWWSDLDVTCLTPAPPIGPYVFRTHGTLPVVGNIMRCPVGSPLMKYCYDRASREVGALNDDWHRPIRILCEGIARYNLEHFVHATICNNDFDEEVLPFLSSDKELPASWHFIHWLNHLSKKQSTPGSTMAHLLRQYGCTLGDPERRADLN